MEKVRVRFAPSPTGYLHIGGLRSALYNYLFAKKNNGTFILRIEDTDQKRYVKEALENLIRSLQWAGIAYDEGVYIENGKIVQRGDYGPYIQSERLEIYKRHAEQLVKENKAYYCFCTPERLEKMRKKQVSEKKAPMYDRCCLELSLDEIKNKLEKEPYTVRLKIPRGEKIEFDDIVRGKVSFDTDNIDDQILLKSDGYPTYHLANVVDDHLMEITHVIRGEEWLSSTPKHVILYRAFSWKEPEFAHLPLILTADRKKLSKRTGDVSVEDYIQKGYLKEAIINFVALLGWNPGKGSTQEIFSLEELIKQFDLEKVHKGGAVFDLQKLDWINSQYIKKLSTDELYQYSMSPSVSPSLSPLPSPEPPISLWEEKEFYKKADAAKKSPEYLKKVLTVEQERISNLAGVGESHKFFFQDPVYEKELLRWKQMNDEEVKESLQKSQEILKNISENNWTKENLEKTLLETAGDKPASPSQGGRGEFLWPLRVALTGAKKSPPPGQVAWVLGKKEALKRLGQALEKL